MPKEDGATVDEQVSIDINEVSAVDCSKQRSHATRVRSETSSWERSKGAISIGWCTTASTVDEFATKPLQGALLWKVRAKILGVVEMPKEVDLAKVDARPTAAGKKVDVKVNSERKTVGRTSNKATRKTRVATSKGERRGRFDLETR